MKQIFFKISWLKNSGHTCLFMLSLLWGLKNLQQSCLPLYGRHPMCNLFIFWQNSNSGKWMQSCQAWVIFRACGYLYWACVVQVSHPDPKVVRKGQAAHHKLFLNERKNKCKSPPLITRNSGNFLLCFMNKCWPIQASCFVEKCFMPFVSFDASSQSK